MISVPPFPEEAVLAAERKELANRILIALMPNTRLSPVVNCDLVAAYVVRLADALLAELAK